MDGDHPFCTDLSGRGRPGTPPRTAPLTKPDWFSDALMRKHPVIAQRLSWDEARVPVSARSPLSTATWLQVAPTAAGREALVGGVSPGAEPDHGFAEWAVAATGDVPGFERRPFALDEERRMPEQRLENKRSFQKAENRDDALPLFPARDARPTVMP